MAPYPARIQAESLGAEALAVVERLGWDGWSLRQVAAELGVTANALYRHVDDRAGLVVAMGEAAAGELGTRLRRRTRAAQRKHPDEPDLAVIALARAFVDFAAKRPHAYDAFMAAKPQPDHPAYMAWAGLWLEVLKVVSVAVPASTDAAGFALWAFLHGRVELARGAAYRAPIDAGLDDAIRAMLTGFRETSPVASPLPEDLRSPSEG